MRAFMFQSHTYQIAFKPPALRAMVTSSLPYFSSAVALHNHNTALPRHRHHSLHSCAIYPKCLSPPHFQELLHVFACPSAIIKPLNYGVIPTIADEVHSLQYHRYQTTISEIRDSVHRESCTIFNFGAKVKNLSTKCFTSTWKKVLMLPYCLMFLNQTHMITFVR